MQFLEDKKLVGMRISVNQHGDRMDNPATVHKTNILTVIANESYKDLLMDFKKI